MNEIDHRKLLTFSDRMVYFLWWNRTTASLDVDWVDEEMEKQEYIDGECIQTK